jgi:hypothetical protein
MKFKLLIGFVAFAMLSLALARWALDGVRWAVPARAA